jgi:hypothetical protein
VIDPTVSMLAYRKEAELRRAARRAKRNMMRIGDVKIHAFEDRQGQFIFVKIPDEYGRYVRTRVAVVLSDCPACKAALGEPCRGQYNRYTGSIHADRMVKARRVLVDMIPGAEGGVGKAIAQDGEEPPYAANDLVHDEAPLEGAEIMPIDVDLRRFFK